jgi:hypothetical protein
MNTVKDFKICFISSFQGEFMYGFSFLGFIYLCLVVNVLWCLCTCIFHIVTCSE